MTKEELHKLLTLQEKELKLSRLLKERDKILKDIENQNDTLKSINENINNILKNKEIILDNIENTIKNININENMLRNTEGILKTIKSKEHYKNIIRERSKIENLIINSKNLLKQLNLKLQELENSSELKQLKSEQKRSLEEIKNLEDDYHSVENSISRLLKEIEIYKSGIDKQLLDFYENAKKRITPVFVQIDKRACSYCGNVLPLDLYNKLIQNDIYSFMCPNCQRLIYKYFDII